MVGGIHGTGFKTKQDMIDNIPFWKLYRKGDEIKAVSMYKDKNGRKRVAVGTDGSDDGKLFLSKFARDDLLLNKSYMETSSNLLFFVIKTVGVDFINHIVSIEKVLSKLSTDDIKTDAKYKDEFIVGFDKKASDGYFSKVENISLIRESLYQNCYARLIGDSYHTKIMLGNVDSLPIIKY